MGRIRSIKPEFSHSEAIVALPRDVRLHFIQLWTYADDHGRGKDEPRVIKGAIWPLDDDVTPEMVEAWQCVLAEHGRIARYTVDGRQFFEIKNWHEHQKPNRRTDSKIAPADQGVPVVAVQAQCVSSADAVQAHREFSAVVVGGGVEVEGDVEVEVDAAGSGVGQLPVVGADDDSDAAEQREQAVRATAVLVGRNQAAVKGNGAGYAATVTRRILTDADRGDRDRDRIRAALDAGQTPEQIAAGWDSFDPLFGTGVPPADDPAAVAAAADRAAKREAESAAKLAEIRDAATDRAPMPDDLRKRIHALPDLPASLDPAEQEETA